MPRKPKSADPTFRSILFRADDDRNVAKIQARQKRLDPARPKLTISDAVRYALAVAAAEQS